MYKSTSYVIGLLFVLIGTGCAPVYLPSARHAHLLDKKGELSVGGYAGINGADVQAAYAISPDIGILAAGSFDKKNDPHSTDYHKHRYGELGLQYQYAYGIGRLELISGIGTGSATAVDNFSFSSSNIQATGSYNKYFIQPNVGLETNIFEAGLALRMGRVVFTEFKTNSSRYTDNKSADFFEPALFAGLGGRHLKVEGQIGVSTPLQNDIGFDYEPFFFSLGLHLDFNLLATK